MSDRELIEELLETLTLLVKRIDHNGGIGAYNGGPAFVMKHAREAIEKAELRPPIERE